MSRSDRSLSLAGPHHLGVGSTRLAAWGAGTGTMVLVAALFGFGADHRDRAIEFFHPEARCGLRASLARPDNDNSLGQIRPRSKGYSV